MKASLTATFYGLWDELTQSWAAESSWSLMRVASELYSQSWPDSYVPCRRNGEFNPIPLSKAEWTEVRKAINDAE